MAGSLLIRKGILRFGRVVTEGPPFTFERFGSHKQRVSILSTTNRKRPVVLRMVSKSISSAHIFTLAMKMKDAQEFHALLARARQQALDNPNMPATEIGRVKVSSPFRLKILAGYRGTVAFGTSKHAPFPLPDPLFDAFFASLDSAINAASGGSALPLTDSIHR